MSYYSLKGGATHIVFLVHFVEIESKTMASRLRPNIFPLFGTTNLTDTDCPDIDSSDDKDPQYLPRARNNSDRSGSDSYHNEPFTSFSRKGNSEIGSRARP